MAQALRNIESFPFSRESFLRPRPRSGTSVFKTGTLRSTASCPPLDPSGQHSIKSAASLQFPGVRQQVLWGLAHSSAQEELDLRPGHSDCIEPGTGCVGRHGRRRRHVHPRTMAEIRLRHARKPRCLFAKLGAGTNTERHHSKQQGCCSIHRQHKYEKQAGILTRAKVAHFISMEHP